MKKIKPKKSKNKYDAIRSECMKWFFIAPTDEQIEKYAATHPILKRDVNEGIFDTFDRDLFIDALVVDVVGEDWHWPLNGDPDGYGAKFYPKFFPKALDMGIGMPEWMKKNVLKSRLVVQRSR